MPQWVLPPLLASWGTGRRETFVGRQQELATLAETHSLISVGSRQVVFVGGEPGVGKTRLVAEAAAHLHEQGANVLLGTCVANMGAPYQPFVQPIEALLGAIAAGELPIDDVGGEAEHVERLRTITGTDRSAQDAVPQLFTRQLFGACLETLQAAARARPMVLVLEDLHWAGDTSLQLLRYLVQRTAESPLLVLATQRTTPHDRSAALVSTVAELYRMDGVRRLDLGGLATDEITDYLAHEAHVPTRSARGAAAVLRDQTGGNPFLLRELWRELAARGGVSAVRSAALGVPESVSDTVQNRLDGLPAVHRRTLEIAAVIGEEFPVALLSAVVDKADDSVNLAAQTLGGLDAACALGLLEPPSGLDAMFRFPHALARQAVLGLMSELQRAADNARVAVVLEEQFPAADLRIQRLAHHYASAQALGYGGKAVEYLVQAADAAEAGLAHWESGRLFEQAAGITDDPARRDDLRLRSARSYLRCAHFGRSRELNELVGATANGSDRVRAAVGYEAASWRSGEPGERAVALLTNALAAAGSDVDDVIVVRAIAALGRAHAFTGNVQEARARGAEAVARARASGNDRLLAAALQVGLQDGLAPAHLAEKLERARELTALSERIGDLRHLGPAAYYRAAISYIQGRPAELAAAQDDLGRVVHATGQAYYEWVQACVGFGEHFLRSDFEAASAAIARTQELGRSFGPGDETEGALGLQEFMVRRETGRLEPIRGLITGDEDTATHWTPGLLAIYCELGLREPAERVLQLLLDRELPRHQISATWPVVLGYLCEAAAWLGGRAAAERLLPLVTEYAGLNLMGGEFLGLLGSADRQLAALESLLGLPAAEAHFEAALELDTRTGSPLHVATTLAAQLVHLRRSRDHSGRAAEVADEARALSVRHELVRVARLLDAVEGPRRSGALPAGLTSREVQVLQLLGNGMSNRGIAKELVISDNTAANHVRSILMKIGAANRTQAAMYASAHGLLD